MIKQLKEYYPNYHIGSNTYENVLNVIKPFIRNISPSILDRITTIDNDLYKQIKTNLLGVEHELFDKNNLHSRLLYQFLQYKWDNHFFDGYKVKSEYLLKSDKFKVAGTIDLILENDEEIKIIKWKMNSSNDKKPKNILRELLEIGIYKILFLENRNWNVQKKIILEIVFFSNDIKNDAYQVHRVKSKRVFSATLHRLGLDILDWRREKKEECDLLVQKAETYESNNYK